MEERNLRKTRVGVVVSDKMDKTIVVAVKDSVQHPLYKKILKRFKSSASPAPVRSSVTSKSSTSQSLACPTGRGSAKEMMGWGW